MLSRSFEPASFRAFLCEKDTFVRQELVIILALSISFDVHYDYNIPTLQTADRVTIIIRCHEVVSKRRADS